MDYKIENTKQIIITKPLELDCGQTIKDFPIAYETYGKLNKEKNNAILIFHALTGDQFVAGNNPITNKEGWWATAVVRKAVTQINTLLFVLMSRWLYGIVWSKKY